MKIASIETITEVRAHPNADRLDIVKVLGYEAIVPRGEHQPGEPVLFVQPDSVLPETEWAAPYRKFAPKRVKAIRLRGLWSMGLVVPLKAAPVDPATLVGVEVSGPLGIQHYEPPAPQVRDALGGLPYGMPKTDEERWQNLEHLPYGQAVDVTLKIDGESMTVFCRQTDTGWDSGVCGRSLRYKLIDTNPLVLLAQKYDALNKLEAYCRARGLSLALRGERHGKGVQASKHNPHAQLAATHWAVFSVLDLATLRYFRRMDPLYFPHVCAELGLPAVRFLERGVPLTPELIAKYDSELKEIDGQPFEGVVINGPDFSFKVVNKWYDAEK